MKDSAGQSGNTPPRFLLSTAGPLAPRQVEILQMSASGLREREIARRLNLSFYTVHNHLTEIRRRLGACNNMHAVAIGLRDKVISLEEVSDADESSSTGNRVHRSE